MSPLIMLVSAVMIIVIVKYGLIPGIEHIAGALKWSTKGRGQATGFATSAPELVCLVATGLAGVWEAGLWNIASSNIINAVLMVTAVLWNRQFHELFNRQFIDEIVFAALAVAVPLLLMGAKLDESGYVIPVLLGFFMIYRFVDRRANPPAPEAEEVDAVGSLPRGLIFTVTALVCVAIAGFFLGGATEDVVNQMGVHPAAAGWILGLTSSLPEMITFFAVYSASRKAGDLDSLADTQEVLDNLTASNMANVGLIYPTGLAVYLAAGALVG